MATNHTENYALNLWEPTDKFVREEFNQDNAKIDAALAGLGQIHIFEQGDFVNYINLENIDWTAWRLVGVAICTPFHNNLSSFVACDLWDDSGCITARCTDHKTTFALLGHASSLLIMAPFFDPDRDVSAFYFGGRTGIGTADCKYSQIKKISLGFGGGGFPDGGSFIFWGMK